MLYTHSGWDGFHPIVSHILIVLLLSAPLLVIIAIAFSHSKRRLLLGTALVAMVLGTATTFVAFSTGESDVRRAASAPSLRVALEEHHKLAVTARELFFILTVVFAALFYSPRLLGREIESGITTALLAIYLLFYASGAVILLHTAQQGGRMVRDSAIKRAATHQLSDAGN